MGEDATGRSSPELPVGPSWLSCSERTKMKVRKLYLEHAGRKAGPGGGAMWSGGWSWWSEVRQVEYRQRRDAGREVVSVLPWPAEQQSLARARAVPCRTSSEAPATGLVERSSRCAVPLVPSQASHAIADVSKSLLNGGPRPPGWPRHLPPP